MTRFSSKAELVKEIHSARSRLVKNIAELNQQELEMPGAVGEWSVKDVMAHLMDWEQRFINWYRAGLKGETPEIPAPGMNWGRLNELNHQIYERYYSLPLEEIQTRFDASSREILALIEGMTEEKLFKTGTYAWTGHEALAGWAASNTCNHYDWAKTKIRAWRKSKLGRAE